MKIYAPDYYKDFRCIADKCRHSCCIGWEIDIDSETMKKYSKVKGNFGTRLKESIKTEDGISCFILGENERCPFLNDNGLCDIYSNLGEDSLSQICTDHPRFRNFFSDREELGLGFCCEEVCRIILSKKDKSSIVIIKDDGDFFELFEDEKTILKIRENLFEIAQNRDVSIAERCENILNLFNISLPSDIVSMCIDAFSKMEILDPEWKKVFGKLNATTDLLPFYEPFEIPFEQLLVYFIYRHIADAENDFDLAARIFFSVLSVRLINNIFEILRKESTSEPFALLCDVCRMYSSEIEYCEENTEILKQLYS